MRAYYTGAAPPSLLALPPHERKLIDALVNYYIRFHALCFWYWSEIDQGKKAQGLYVNMQSPGAALHRLAEIECFAMMMRSEQYYCRYSVAEKRAVFELSRKIANQGDQLDPTLMEELRHLEQSDEWLKPYFNFRDGIWHFCFNQKRQSSEQRQALKEFRAAVANRDAAIAATLHKRHGRRGYEWCDGIKTQLRVTAN